MSQSSLETLNALADRWFDYMVYALVDASVGLALVTLIFLIVRRWVPPRWCYLLFLIVPLKVLLPMSLPLLPGIATTAETSNDPNDPVAFSDDALSRAFGVSDSSIAKSARLRSAAEASALAAARAAPSIEQSPAVSASAKTLMMTVWAAIVVALILRFVRNHHRLRRLLATARPVSLAEYDVRTDEIHACLAVTRPVRVLASGDFHVPAVVGVWNTKIVLPDALIGSLPSSQLACILAHELAHVKWHDLPIAMLERLLRIVHFINPAIWIAGRMAHTWREHACDDASLMVSGADRRTVGLTLLRVLELAHGQRPSSAPVVALFERTRTYHQRLQRIMTTPFRTRPFNGWITVGLIAVAAMLLPNLRAASPNSQAAVDATEETAEDPLENAGREMRGLPAREPAVVVDGPSIIEQQHDVAKLLRSGTDPERLVHLIKKMVLITTWDETGGAGQISIDAEKSTLHVKHSKSVQLGIERLIETFEQVVARDKGDGAKPRVSRSIGMLCEDPGLPTEQIVSVYVVPSLLYANARKEGSADFDTLIALITRLVDEASWDEVGGRGRIEPWPGGDSLIIAASKATHERIQWFISRLEVFANRRGSQ
ncbi:MAG: M56 family metallopeptidase [Pirellulaceae bacterium]